MKLTKPSDEYIEKAKRLSRDDAERVFSRMRGKLWRRLDDNTLGPLEAVAAQLELEDRHLEEWRHGVAKIRAAHKKS